jgi:hypothetical protein
VGKRWRDLASGWIHNSRALCVTSDTRSPRISDMVSDSSDIVAADNVNGAPTLNPEHREKLSSYQRDEKAEATVRAYEGDALLFDAWCRAHGFARSIPASVDMVSGFLAHEAERGVKASTISCGAATNLLEGHAGSSFL